MNYSQGDAAFLTVFSLRQKHLIQHKHNMLLRALIVIILRWFDDISLNDQTSAENMTRQMCHERCDAV